MQQSLSRKLHNGADCSVGRHHALLRAVCSVTATDTRLLLIGWALKMDTMKYLPKEKKLKIIKQQTALITFTVISGQLYLNFHTTSVFTDYHKWLRHFQIKAVTQGHGMDISSGYQDHKPRLLSQENKRKIQPKELLATQFPTCLLQWQIQGKGLGGPPPLIFRPTIKFFLETAPLSKGLDLALDCIYSQLSLRRTPLGPVLCVRLREKSVLQRVK